MAQTVYSNEPSRARIGQLSDIGFHDIVSKYSAAQIPFGRFVSYDAADSKVKLPAAATDIVNTGNFAVSQGVALEDPSKESTPSNTLGVANANAPAHDIGDAIPVIKRGRVWVWVEQAVSPTDTVFVRFTANGDEKPGNFRKDADTDKAESLGENARFATTTTGAGLVLLDIRL